MDFNTLCIHGSDKKYDVTGAVSVPIFQSATFAHPGVGVSTGFDYSRTQNPTREHLERTVAALEKGCDAVALATGMAAASVLMGLFSPGDHLVASDDLYGGTHRLFFQLAVRYGITFTLVDTADLAAVRNAVTDHTRAIFVETPTNPMMQVTDIAAAAALARERGLLLAVDNTFLTPYLQSPLALGADIVLHSGTKYLGGHNDALAGFLAVKDPGLAAKLRFIANTVGAGLAPFDSWLIIRGIKTLAVRMDRQQESAGKIAARLLEYPEVTDVFYPGLPSHPGYEISKRQARGGGAMISFNVRDAETARRLLGKVKVILYAESLGGVESLITYPMLQTHADVPEAEREAKGIGARLLRLSVGLESAEDLIADLRRALDA
ncbi:MAG: PLP-dependent aspartate aminotransferase family protein [Oscillospiraceae bacterium]|jgi:cystathionine beta-lyase/cystathionine gamma-synthase|nr:PLP-dependent aspartate aminotransferase family protein [Oscillospiraceae bacterium]